jgi:hypothetical protein
MPEITVLAEEGPITFDFDDLVRYHGHAALAMLAVTFRAQEHAFTTLCENALPARSAITVVSGHPGPGVRDGFEMVSRCVTRGAYAVDRTIDGPRLNPNSDVVYAFEITIAGRGAAHLAVRNGVLPDAFFAHLNAPANPADLVSAASLRREIAEAVVRERDPETLFLGTFGSH